MSGSFLHLRNESGFLVFGGGAVVLFALCMVQARDPDRRIGALLVLGKTVETVISLLTVVSLLGQPFIDRTIFISMGTLAAGDTLILLILILLQRRRTPEPEPEPPKEVTPVELPDYEEIELEED